MKTFTRTDGGDLLRRCRRGIEEFLDQTDRISRSRTATLKPEQLGNHTPQVLIAEYFRFLYAQYLAKYAELTSSLIDAANQQAYLVFALCGRSLLELTALLRYYTKKLQPYIDEAVRTGVVNVDVQKAIIELLDQQARGGRFDWSEFHFGDRAEFAARLVENRKKREAKKKKNTVTQLNPEQVNVQTAIDQWSKEHAGIALAYDYLCELVHPNLGSNFLVMGATGNNLTIGGASNKEIAGGLCDEAVCLLASTAIRDGAMHLAVLSLLAEQDNYTDPTQND